VQITMSRRTLTFIFLIIGLAALVMLVVKVGFRPLLDTLIRFAPAFPLILAIEAGSNLLSTVGWYYSFGPKERPRLTRLQIINFASLPLSGALPTGQAGEVLKGNLLRGSVEPTEIVSSLIIYNYLHVLTTAGIMAIGPVVALFIGGFPPGAALLLGAISVGICAFMAGLGLLMRSRAFERLASLPRRLPIKALRTDALSKWAAELDTRLNSAWKERRGDLWMAGLFLVLGRILAVVEVYAILYYIGFSDSVLITAMVYSGTAMANYVLMALPAREGFLEGSSYVVLEFLGFVGAVGLTLEIVRRLRKIAFQVFGLGVLSYLLRQRGSDSKPGADSAPYGRQSDS